MIYRSNLTCPDLTPNFKHLVSRPMGHSMGHDVPSDWGDKADDDPVFGLYKNCGMWTHDEAAILANAVAMLEVGRRSRSMWVDIGCHTGWTTAHIALGAVFVDCIDPMLRVQEFQDRFEYNVAHCWHLISDVHHQTSEEFFKERGQFYYDGFVVDGDHAEGKPLEDAINAAKHLAETGVVMLHDGVGRPVQEAVRYLMSIGFKARAYYTPHLVFCCFRGDFVPPDHVPDPNVKRQLLDGRFADFDFGAMS